MLWRCMADSRNSFSYTYLWTRDRWLVSFSLFSRFIAAGETQKPTTDGSQSPSETLGEKTNTLRNSGPSRGMRYSIFWDITQLRVAVSNRRFGKTYRSHQRASFDCLILEEGQTGWQKHRFLNTNLSRVTSQNLLVLSEDSKKLENKNQDMGCRQNSYDSWEGSL